MQSQLPSSLTFRFFVNLLRVRLWAPLCKYVSVWFSKCTTNKPPARHFIFFFIHGFLFGSRALHFWFPLGHQICRIFSSFFVSVWTPRVSFNALLYWIISYRISCYVGIRDRASRDLCSTVWTRFHRQWGCQSSQEGWRRTSSNTLSSLGRLVQLGKSYL